MNLPSAKLAHAGTLTTESPLRDLEAIIRSRTPLIAVESNEEPQIVRLVRQIGHRLQIKAYRWTVTEGLQAFDPCDQPPQSVLKSQEVLSYIKSSASYCLFVLLDFHPYLQDTVHVRQLKDIALTYSRHYSTVVLVGYALQVPEELRPYTAHFRLPLPTPDELRGIVYDVAADWGAEHGQRDVQTTNKALDLLVRNLAGLTTTDARRLAEKAITDDGVISESEIPEVMRAKYELLGHDGLLSFEYETVQFSEIGGMHRLRNWLEVRKSYFTEEDQVLDAPRGILLLGVQGCGKSLAAKAAAGIFGVPLLRLDFGVLYNKYYGETERNLRKSLETAEIMSPCVLWIDEVEKGLAVGDGEDDGLSRRVLGTLLTWMSERHKAVFLVATANDITRLPPEFVRKGRFDETFFVDLPSPQNRREILAIHLRKRHLDAAKFDFDALTSATQGFSGSEIEQAIVSAMYTAHAQGRAVSQADLLEETRQTRPLSVLMSENVEEIREWAASRTVSCD